MADEHRLASCEHVTAPRVTRRGSQHTAQPHSLTDDGSRRGVTVDGLVVSRCRLESTLLALNEEGVLSAALSGLSMCTTNDNETRVTHQSSQGASFSHTWHM